MAGYAPVPAWSHGTNAAYFTTVYLIPIVVARTIPALDYFDIAFPRTLTGRCQAFAVTVAFVLPIISLVLLCVMVQKRIWLKTVRDDSSTAPSTTTVVSTLVHALAPTAFACLLTATFQVVFFASPVGAAGNPVMGWAVAGLSPEYKLFVVSTVGELGLVFGLGWVAALLAGHLLGVVRRGHWYAFLTAWLVAEVLGGWTLSDVGMWHDPSIGQWPQSVAPHLRVSCLCAGGSHHDRSKNTSNNVLPYNRTADILRRIELRLAAGDDLVVLSEAALRQRLHAEQLQWNADNPGAVVAVTYLEPVQSVLANSTSDKHYNSIELLQASSGSVLTYYKNRPVPVLETPYIAAGEHAPDPVEVVFTPLSSTENGGTNTTRTNRTLRVAAAICFDFDFPAVLRHARSADLVIGPSNYWSSLGRSLWSDNQYRAIENGFTLFKCARNGISGAVDGAGRILAAEPTLAGETFVSQIPVQEGRKTAFADAGGDWFGWINVGLSIVWVVVAFWPMRETLVEQQEANGTADDDAVLVPARDGTGDMEAPLLGPHENDALDTEEGQTMAASDEPPPQT